MRLPQHRPSLSSDLCSSCCSRIRCGPGVPARWRTGTLAFASLWPRWLLIACITVAALAIVVSLQRRRSLGMAKLAALATLQIAFVALLLCLLWRPILNVERVRDRENVLAVALDASASMAYEDAVDSSRSRLQRAAESFQSDALSDLQKTFEVRLFSFATRADSLPSFETVPAPDSRPSPRRGHRRGWAMP
jgi:hypothetical protein